MVIDFKRFAKILGIVLLSGTASGFADTALQGSNAGANAGMGGNQFATRKAQILARMQQRQQMIAQRIQCVQQAQNPQQLRACMPQRNGQQQQRQQ